MNNKSPNGSLDNDGMVRALLVYRNTPDPGCKLSPAQILLGRPLRDTLPYINKEIMMFNNPEIHPQWKDAWNAKEEALRARYVKTLENLSEHSRPLVSLEPGDHVLIQNQSGRFPKKWDKSGIVIEVRGNDQYTVKVVGSGRLTLRNRRFLRKYEPHCNLQSAMPAANAPQSFATSSEVSGEIPEHNPHVSPAPTGEKSTEIRQQSPAPQTRSGPTRSCVSSLPEMQQQSSAIPVRSEPSSGPCMPFLQDMQPQPEVPPVNSESTGSQIQLLPTTATDQDQTRRSTREKKQRQVYDASTGKYVAPCAVAKSYK